MTMEKIFNMSPTIQRIKAEVARETALKTERKTARKTARETATRLVVRSLSRRFGHVPDDLLAELHAIEDQSALEDLLDIANECASLKKFRAALVKHA